MKGRKIVNITEKTRKELIENMPLTLVEKMEDAGLLLYIRPLYRFLLRAGCSKGDINQLFLNDLTLVYDLKDVKVITVASYFIAFPTDPRDFRGYLSENLSLERNMKAIKDMFSDELEKTQ